MFSTKHRSINRAARIVTVFLAAGALTGGFSSEELKAAGCDAVLAEIKDLGRYLARVGD